MVEPIRFRALGLPVLGNILVYNFSQRKGGRDVETDSYPIGRFGVCGAF